MQVLVTRPEDDAAPLVRELAVRGHSAIRTPMLTVRYLPEAPIDLSGVQALVFTSANGVRAFAHACPRRDLPAVTVGTATAEAAVDAGFHMRETAAGDSQALVRLIAASRAPSDGALFHAAGSVVAGTLKADLESHGFTVRRSQLYAAEPAESLTDEAVQALRGGALDAALFFSPRTARTFVKLACTTHLADPCRRVRAVCLSTAVAETVRELPWRGVHTAERPERAAMLRTLDDLAGTSAPARDEA